MSYPEQEQVPQILIGTSGYSYPDWQGVFYPADLPRDRWLDHYCREFPFSELNFSYYRMPGVKQMERFAAADTRFVVKAHKSLTHERTHPEDSAALFLESVAPLIQDHKLSAVLMQFPFSFQYTPENRRYLDTALERFHDVPVAVEFRHANWLRPSVYEGLRERSAALVATDAPQVQGGMPPIQEVTADLAYIRFHGRNHENWWGGDNVSRYDYDYSEEELREWLPRITEMAQRSQTVYISFNNHARGQAIHNARMLKRILREMGVTPVE